MNLTEMQEKRGRLVTQAREALDEIKNNTDEARSAELEARHDAIMADFDKIEKDIAREERLAKIERENEERAAFGAVVVSIDGDSIRRGSRFVRIRRNRAASAGEVIAQRPAGVEFSSREADKVIPPRQAGEGIEAAAIGGIGSEQSAAIGRPELDIDIRQAGFSGAIEQAVVIGIVPDQVALLDGIEAKVDRHIGLGIGLALNAAVQVTFELRLTGIRAKRDHLRNHPTGC